MIAVRCFRNTPMNHTTLLLASIAICVFSIGAFAADRMADPGPAAFSRQTLLLDQGWRFHLGDIPLNSFPGGQGVSIYGPDFTHSGAKAGYTWGAAARGYNDKTWRQVDLPHDWVVEQPFDESAVKAQGYRKRGIGWYRRVFKLDPSDRGRNIELQFDGVRRIARVFQRIAGTS
jgi:beta-galactosidase